MVNSERDAKSMLKISIRQSPNVSGNLMSLIGSELLNQSEMNKE